jgi:hypothetical protein
MSWWGDIPKLGLAAGRTARFMSARVVALVEHPARRPAQRDDARAPQRPGAA